MTIDPGIGDGLAYPVDEETRLRAALAAAEAEIVALRALVGTLQTRLQGIEDRTVASVREMMQE